MLKPYWVCQTHWHNDAMGFHIKIIPIYIVWPLTKNDIYIMCHDIIAGSFVKSKFIECILIISEQITFIYSFISIYRGVLQYMFLAATKQLYEWFSLFVRLSVCLSVCLSVTPFWLCYHHRISMKFSGVITKDQGKVYAKVQGQRSKVKVTEVTTQLNRFRTVTPVWIHIWWWNDTYSLMLLRRGALLFFKVIRQISRWHGSKNRRIWPKLVASGL